MRGRRAPGARAGLAALAAASGAACAAPAADAPAPLPIAVPFHVIAHRGGAAHAPENTRSACERARGFGVLEVELDVQLSRDGALVLFHDALLDEKTDRRGRVRDHSAAELSEAEIGSWFDRTHPERTRDYAGTRLDTLGAVLAAFGPAFHYHLEIKAAEPEIPHLLLDEIDRHGLRERVTITSFHVEQLERFRALAPEIPLTVLVRENELEAVGWAAAAGYRMLGVRAARLTPELVAAARARGLEMRAYGIRSDADAEHAIAVGANGMTTDWPDRLIARVLEKLSAPQAAPGRGGR